MQEISPPRQMAWNTEGMRQREQFAYYREAICKAFMSLTPEAAPSAPFPAIVENVRLRRGALNRVSHPEHVVRRTAADIAGSDRSCFYLNLKLAGRCCIRQGAREVALSPGQVGIFDSDRQFTLLFSRNQKFQVASLSIPSEDLRERLPAGFDITATRISDDPFVGHLIVDMADALTRAVRMTEDESGAIFRALIDVVAMSLSRESRPRDAESENIVDATTMALKRAIQRRLRQPGLTAANVAKSIGISERYVHKLLARSGYRFADYLIGRRLDGIARELKDPAKAHLPIGTIAFDWGFSDLSHFSRRFRQRFACRPRDWRNDTSMRM